MGPGQDLPEDYFFVKGKRALQDQKWFCDLSLVLVRRFCELAVLVFLPIPFARMLVKYAHTACAVASASSVLLRQKIVKRCRDDIYHFLSAENGQVAIYDAVNPIATGRRSLAKEFGKHGMEVWRKQKSHLYGSVTDVSRLYLLNHGAITKGLLKKMFRG